MQTGQISLERNRNLLGGAAPFYRTYLCADGKEIAVGALKPKFFCALVGELGLPELADRQHDQNAWDDITTQFRSTIQQKSRDEWAKQFDGTDCCVTPVLHHAEVPHHPHMQSRGLEGNSIGVTDMRPVPQLSNHDSYDAEVSVARDADTMLAQWKIG